ncbi:hypothetical protein TNIN_101741 [Trichonephila inaurata madagascariensis]|uniref:Uncharacterized protein n=1 Tax=Trichonephila inaurata madagascariensis TaxID=2747483 RepID=A0A8X6IEY5_9ARAC|nr:hypothetical protein TNIN_101741 [Trichonephila inaurata madagascariensis]
MTSYEGLSSHWLYETHVNSDEDLVARIAKAAGEVQDTLAIFANLPSSMRRRNEACIMTRDGNFEHLTMIVVSIMFFVLGILLY